MSARKTYRCFHHGDVDALSGQSDWLCPHCNEICATVYICCVCDCEEAYDGANECLSCIADQVIADPRELDSCSAELVVEIARELAKRVQPEQRVAA